MPFYPAPPSGGTAPDSLVLSIEHGTDASMTRPDGAMVIWHGSVEPINALDNDFWNETP